MSLLPQNHSQFRQTEYWDGFFRKRGRRAFEWYGEYNELCGVLHKYSRPTDALLVVGCGNSTISADLYDVGYRDVVSVDLSEVVVRQMRAQHARDRPELRFEVADATDMSKEFADGSFSCVLDKGTLDAIFTGPEADVVENVDKMIGEISRVLKVGGRYLCISLLQPHILDHLVCRFEGMGWPLRIVRCKEVETNRKAADLMFPVFAVVATKFRKMEGMTPVFELSLSATGQNNRVKTAKDLKDSVRGMQQFAAVRAGAARSSSSGLFSAPDARREDEVALELRSGENQAAKYSLYLSERPESSRGRGKLKFAVFIVPQGREVEWLFGTAAGRRQLLASSDCERMVVVHLHRSHHFPSLQLVQDELSSYVMELAPSDLPADAQVPFLSVTTDSIDGGGGGVGTRKERSRGHSDLSGDFVVEDVEVDGDTFRRLVFLSSPNLTQSEARLKATKTKSKKVKKVVDHSYLACSHHSRMIAALGLLEGGEAPVRVMLVGLGGGGLPSYLASHFDKVTVDVVEIDPCMGKVAREDFGFQEGKNLRLIIADGLEYIRKYDGDKYDLVMFDVDSKDATVGMSCPPKPFVSKEILQHVRQKCLADKGVFVLNLVCRDETLREETLSDVGGEFSSMASYKIPLEVNEVVYCSSSSSSRPASSGDTGGKKKASSKAALVKGHPVIAAFRAVNERLKQPDFVSLAESVKQLEIIK